MNITNHIEISVTEARGVYQLPYGVATTSLLTNGQADRRSK